MTTGNFSLQNHIFTRGFRNKKSLILQSYFCVSFLVSVAVTGDEFACYPLTLHTAFSSEQNKEIMQYWTGIENFDNCFCIIFNCY